MHGKIVDIQTQVILINGNVSLTQLVMIFKGSTYPNTKKTVGLQCIHIRTPPILKQFILFNRSSPNSYLALSPLFRYDTVGLFSTVLRYAVSPRSVSETANAFYLQKTWISSCYIAQNCTFRGLQIQLDPSTTLRVTNDWLIDYWLSDCLAPISLW